MDGEVGARREILHQRVHGAARERDGGPTAGAEEVVTVSWHADDIRGLAVWLKDAGEDIERRENLERSIDGSATELWRAGLDIADDLLGGKRPWAIKDRLNDRQARMGCPVAVTCQDLVDLWRGEAGVVEGVKPVSSDGIHGDSLASRSGPTVSARFR